jgi:hypothetical protein
MASVLVGTPRGLYAPEIDGIIGRAELLRRVDSAPRAPRVAAGILGTRAGRPAAQRRGYSPPRSATFCVDAGRKRPEERVAPWTRPQQLDAARSGPGVGGERVSHLFAPRGRADEGAADGQALPARSMGATDRAVAKACPPVVYRG